MNRTSLSRKIKVLPNGTIAQNKSPKQNFSLSYILESESLIFTMRLQKKMGRKEYW